MTTARLSLHFVLLISLYNIAKTSCYVYTDKISIPQGDLKGIKDVWNDYNAYLGIPYAKVGERFQEAVPVQPWNRTFFATKGSIKCKQYFKYFKTPIGQEDCLVLNIFTPLKKIENKTLPVMIFIHGGGFYRGSNSDLIYSPTLLVKKNVIVVTINYRLGAFGFLCLHKTSAPGNIGIKDQIAAIKWVKNNIEAFGGNANDITLVGQSAGAASVHFIIVSGAYKGLFSKAIIESGSILSPMLFSNDPINNAYFVASRMGYQGKDIDELIKIFKNANSDQITEASYVDNKNNVFGAYLFGPCKENKTLDNSLITENPKELIKLPITENLKVILGYNSKEGIMYAGRYDIDGLTKLNSNISQIVPRNLKFDNNEQQEAIKDAIKKQYFRKNGLTYINHSNLINYFSDSIIIYPSLVSANAFLSNNITMYNYYFSYSSLRNLNKFISGLPLENGANHADELFYLFDSGVQDLIPPKPNDIRMSEILTTLWANFVKHGKPTFTYDNVEWEESKNNGLTYLQLDKVIKKISLPDEEKLTFWNPIYENYRAY